VPRASKTATKKKKKIDTTHVNEDSKTIRLDFNAKGSEKEAFK